MTLIDPSTITLGNGLNDDLIFIIEAREVPAWTGREVHSSKPVRS